MSGTGGGLAQMLTNSNLSNCNISSNESLGSDGGGISIFSSSGLFRAENRRVQFIFNYCNWTQFAPLD